MHTFNLAERGEIYTGVGLLQHHLNRGKNQIPNMEAISLYMYMEGTAYCGAEATLGHYFIYR